MSERFCPVCGRANRSDLPRCMNCGQRMMPAAPVENGRSVLLQREDDETQTVVRTGTHTPWWQTPDGETFGSIPPPPQVKEEMERFAAREEAKASVARAEEAAKEATLAHERKKAAAALARSAAAVARASKMPSAPAVVQPASPLAAAASVAAQGKCVRCGTAPPSGGGFSFCLSCGGDLTPGTAAALNGSATPSGAVRPASASHSVSSPNTATGLRMQQADTKTGTNTNTAGIVSITSATTATSVSSFPPAVAALMSFFVPGLGQIVNGQVGKGVVLLLASFFVSAILFIPTMGLFPLLGRIVAALDAYRIAERRRKGRPVRPDEWDV